MLNYIYAYGLLIAQGHLAEGTHGNSNPARILNTPCAHAVQTPRRVNFFFLIHTTVFIQTSNGPYYTPLSFLCPHSLLKRWAEILMLIPPFTDISITLLVY